MAFVPRRGSSKMAEGSSARSAESCFSGQGKPERKNEEKQCDPIANNRPLLLYFLFKYGGAKIKEYVTSSVMSK